MDNREARRLKHLEDENRKLKHGVAERMLDNRALKGGIYAILYSSTLLHWRLITSRRTVAVGESSQWSGTATNLPQKDQR